MNDFTFITSSTYIHYIRYLGIEQVRPRIETCFDLFRKSQGRRVIEPQWQNELFKLQHSPMLCYVALAPRRD